MFAVFDPVTSASEEAVAKDATETLPIPTPEINDPFRKSLLRILNRLLQFDKLVSPSLKALC